MDLAFKGHERNELFEIQQDFWFYTPEILERLVSSKQGYEGKTPTSPFQESRYSSSFLKRVKRCVSGSLPKTKGPGLKNQQHLLFPLDRPHFFTPIGGWREGGTGERRYLQIGKKNKFTFFFSFGAPTRWSLLWQVGTKSIGEFFRAKKKAGMKKPLSIVGRVSAYGRFKRAKAFRAVGVEFVVGETSWERGTS